MREDGDLLLRAVVRTLGAKVDETDSEQPSAFMLRQNYPNPFNGATRISFNILEPTKHFLRIADMNGKLLFEQTFRRPGAFDVLWDGTNLAGESLPSGIYIVSLQSFNVLQSRKMTLLR